MWNEPHLPRQHLPKHRSLSSTSPGRALAALLERSWREPVSFTTAPDPAVLELAIAGGGGALAYRRLEAPPSSLRDLYRHQVIEAARFEHGLVARIKALRARGVVPTLVKGWAIARRYPGKGLRHFSDLDLCVAPSERADAEAAIASCAADRLETDLHVELPHVEGRDRRELERRMVDVPLHDVVVRTLGDEDHLWLLAQHALGHGLWRSVWLVDLAVLGELPLDWDYVLRGPPNRVDAVRVGVALARAVLGANVPAHPLPSWAEPALLAEWSSVENGYLPLTQLPRLRDLPDELRRRWPNPLRATVALDARWNEWPRLPLQLYDLGRRLARFARSHDDPRGIWKK